MVRWDTSRYNFVAGCLIGLFILGVILLVAGSCYSVRMTREKILTEMKFMAQRVITQMGEKHLYKSEYLVESMANMTNALIDQGKGNRETIQSMLYGLVREHPDITGIGVAFSPNGFDSSDCNFRSAPGCDENGRFLPYYTMDSNGTPVLDPLYSYVIDEPDSYYFAPMRSLQPHVTDIYKSKILDEEMLMFTISWPLFRGTHFAGVVLADVTLEHERELIQSLDFYGNEGTIFLLSTKRRIISHSQEADWAGLCMDSVDRQHAPNDNEMLSLLRGEQVMRISKDEYMILHPLFLAQHDVPLILGLVLPKRTAIAWAEKHDHPAQKDTK